MMTMLGGCAHQTPGSIRQEGERFSYQLRSAPEQAASCMAANAEEHYAGLRATIRQTAPGTYEVQVRIEALIALASIAPAERGSSATVWRAPYLSPVLWEVPPSMAKGC